MLDNPNVASLPATNIQLNNLGENRNGVAIKALAIDTICLCMPDLAMFGVTSRTHHHQKVADILFSDGHAVTSPNTGGRYTVSLQSPNDLSNAFSRILGVLEQADLAD